MDARDGGHYEKNLPAPFIRLALYCWNAAAHNRHSPRPQAAEAQMTLTDFDFNETHVIAISEHCDDLSWTHKGVFFVHEHAILRHAKISRDTKSASLVFVHPLTVTSSGTDISFYGIKKWWNRLRVGVRAISENIVLNPYLCCYETRSQLWKNNGCDNGALNRC